MCIRDSGFIDPLTVLTHVESDAEVDTRAMTIRPTDDDHSRAPTRSAWVLSVLGLALAAWAVWRGLRPKN